MDTVSHFLWVYGLCRVIKECKNRNIDVLRISLFSVLPDVVSFLPIVVYVIYLFFIHAFPYSDFMSLSLSHGDLSLLPIKMSMYLYRVFHSYLIWIIVFALYRRLEIIGWGIHITLDIFTHAKGFNPTLFLWPLSNYYFNGIPWENIYFLLFNWMLLFVLYVYLWKNNKLKSF